MAAILWPTSAVAPPSAGLRRVAARGTLVNGAFDVVLSSLGLVRGLVVAAFLTREEYGVFGVLAATLATLLWLAASIGLFAYVQTLGSYESTYGSLAGVVISMLWLWITVFLVIAGAAVNAEAERETVRDSTVGPEQPVGRRGAVVADSVPPYPGEE